MTAHSPIVIRNMRWDFADAPMLWSPNRAFATTINAGSPSAVAFEYHLSRVMMRARDEIGDHDPELRREIDLFIAQEGHHYRAHKAYNKRLFAAYPRAKDFEEELAAKLDHRFETQSLVENLAFSAGFENFACYMAKYQFTRGQRHFEGADPQIAMLWKWHAAEEYEHRSACNHALSAMGGTYAIRIRGLFDFLKLILEWQGRLVAYMLEVDRAGMNDAERAESVRAKKAFDRELLLYTVPRMLRIFTPYYDPAPVRAPEALHEALADYEALTSRATPAGAGAA